MNYYEEIYKYVKQKHGFTVKPCWISDVKELCGLPRKKGSISHTERLYPCPEDKIKAIKDGFRHVGWI